MLTRTILPLLAGFCLTACSGNDGATGPQGPEGPQGAQGAPGPQGPVGNANVVQYNFGAHNFATNPILSLQVATTAEIASRSAWFVYLVRASGNIYPVPGFGLNGSSEYRVYWSHSAGNVNFTISRVSGTGEDYSAVRIVRVYANTVNSSFLPALGATLSEYTPPSREVFELPELDFRNYGQVSHYYGLTK